MREMKDSGISWVGEIPKEWTIMPLYCFYSERKNKNIFGAENNLLSLSYGKVIRKDINTSEGLLPSNYNGYNIVEAGDIIIRPTDLQNDNRSLRTGLSQERGIITSAYIALKPKNGINSRFYHYLLHTYDILKVFYNMGNGVRQGLNYDEFAKLMVYSPSDTEQQRIAEFLDRECGKIDGLKADIQAQIDTLEQYKRSVITEAVTHGLNPSAPMKDSGIPWVDEVPQNWGIRRVKYIATCLKKGNGITKEDIVEDGDTLCIRYGEIYTKYNLSFFECTTRTNKERISSKQYFTQGDILFAGTGELIEEIGKNIVYLGTGDCLAGGDIIILKHKQNARYLNYALNSECVQAQKSCKKAKLKVVHISAFEIGNIKIALPPLDEQQEIADYLDNKCAAIEQIIADKKSQIETLDGYKKSLIYEYVTGKKEVV